VKFGIAFANAGIYADRSAALTLARAAEEAGFESLWTIEHVVVPAGYESTYPYSRSGRMPGPEDAPIPDPLIWLAWVGAATERIRLATGILILPQRNPVVVAKEIATLDWMSGGRFILGVGAGWLKEEFEVIGVPFEHRGRRLDEYIGALRALWTQGTAGFDGETVSFSGAISRPQPAQGSVPVVIGGHSDAAARRAGRLGDGFFPGKGDLAHLISVMREAAVEAGRDPDAVELTASGHECRGPDALDAVARLADLGVSRVVFAPPTYDPAEIREALLRYGDAVIAKAV
jgi:probable F420-dependent oxidoreductase